MRVLVVGGGIAGLTVAIQLQRSGHEIALMERRSAPPPEGYMIDFFGPGFDVAERMSLLPALAEVHYPIEHLLFLDGRGRIRAELPYRRLRKEIFRDRHFNFMRGDLERVLYQELDPRVSVSFGVSPVSLALRDGSVEVEATDGTRGTYDLVVGADGLHSQIRELVFSPAETKITYLGCHTAAYVVQRPVSGIAGDAFSSLSGAGIMAAAYPIRVGRTATFFVHRAETPLLERSPETCRRELEAAYRGRGWRLDDLLDAFPQDGSVYFDDVSQVTLSSWSRGRVVLVGDACGCVSLLAGQGASMAMTGGYILAREIDDAGTHLEAALRRYEARVRPAVEERQRIGQRNIGWFLPGTRVRAGLRDRLMHLAVRTPATRLLRRSLGGSSVPLD